ncbi:uncharacterized protein BX663DRAFT_514195 [Cokeromyces recurvatus]|uniref:uncharacterized protein n=1 Tax=Cokeromyces recurvatus TaxID=90255 RepID=UPI00221EFD1E|nr:uncharacterized protein BX663DRAFT_514195 [Cokeromyces recurvatus]KAI7901352.1 hypothetical protein BX663DRAFT_514195 [Cokeromyces recurvatus]
MALTEAQKICKQVNFYFSDSNLPYDKFLWTLRSNSPNGWIPIETIANFKKMKMITEDLDTVVKALKENESDIYEVDEEGKNIRRKTEVVQQDHISRSIYIKGLPLVDVDTEDPIAETFKLQDQVDEFFSEKAKVLCVRLKKTHERPYQLKGSAYVEFETPEDAQKIADLKEVEMDGHKLELMYRPKYIEMKSEQFKNAPPPKKRFRTFNAFYVNNNSNNVNNKRKADNGFAKNGNDKKQKTKNEEVKEKEESS